MMKIEPVTLEQIPPEWIAERREIVVRDGFALRAALGPVGFTIEVKSLVTNQWMRLALPGNATEFAVEAERDAVLRALEGRD